jgi:hypothetical protein
MSTTISGSCEKVCIKELFNVFLQTKELFNTLRFFAPEEEFHPVGRPFARCFKCLAESSLLYMHTLLQRLPWQSQRLKTKNPRSVSPRVLEVLKCIKFVT